MRHGKCIGVDLVFGWACGLDGQEVSFGQKDDRRTAEMAVDLDHSGVQHRLRVTHAGEALRELIKALCRLCSLGGFGGLDPRLTCYGRGQKGNDEKGEKREQLMRLID